MDAVITIFWVLHLTATAGILGGWVTSMFLAKYGLPVMAWAARAQIVIGLILVNLTYAHGLNFSKVVVKIVLGVIVVGLVEVTNARFKRGESTQVVASIAAALTVLTAALSFLW